MGELVVAQPVIRLDVAVSLPLDMISTLSLLYRAVPGSGLDPWLATARRALPDETRYDLDILQGFSGRLLYFLEEPIARFEPLAPENRDATFADLLDLLVDLTPADYLAMAIHAVQRVRADQGMDTTAPALDDDASARDLAWRRFLEPALTTATPDEIIPILERPEDLRLRTINLFRVVWTTAYRDEFLHTADLMASAAEHARAILHRGFGRAFSDLTGSRLPSTLAMRLHDISEIWFHPSAHLGNHISFLLDPPRGIVFFDADRFLATVESVEPRPSPGPPASAPSAAAHLDPLLRDIDDLVEPTTTAVGEASTQATVDARPLTVAALPPEQVIETARALGDPTRLRILEMLGGGERYAQELVTSLQIAQSAVSRHLSLLERCGLVSVRPYRGMKYYSIDRAHVARFAETVQHHFDGPPGESGRGNSDDGPR